MAVTAIGSLMTPVDSVVLTSTIRSACWPPCTRASTTCADSRDPYYTCQPGMSVPDTGASKSPLTTTDVPAVWAGDADHLAADASSSAPAGPFVG